MQSRLITEDELAADLNAAGFSEGELLMVHSSLSRIGNVEGGPDAVIKAFIKTVGKSGTLVMPAYNSAQEALKQSRSGDYIDLRTHPSAVGKITETFRKWPEVKRSSHPFSSCCAWGALAADITESHHINSDVCHVGSPVGKLVALNGRVVGVGIPLAQGLGVAHYVEDTWDQFPFEVHSEEMEVSYINAAGEKITRMIRRYNPAITRTRVDYPEGAWINEQLTNHLTRAGIMQPFKFGEAESWYMHSSDLAEEIKRLAAKGVTMYLTKDKLTGQNRSIETW